MLDVWYDWFFNILQDFTPRKTKHWKLLAPWVKPETSHLIKRVETLGAKKLCGELKKMKLEKAKTELALVLPSDQKEFETSILQHGSFSDVQRYMKSFSSNNYLPSEIFLEGQTARTDVEKAELFNRYFQSFFSSENHKEAKIEVEGEINSLPFTHNGIFKILKNLDVNKAKGPDRVGKHLLKRCASHCHSHYISFLIPSQTRETSLLPGN